MKCECPFAILRSQDKTRWSSLQILPLLVCLLFVPVHAADIMRLEGTHKEMGQQHGNLAREHIRLMISEYIGDELIDGKLNDSARKKITAMKESLPEWFMDELNACADEVGLDRDVLLYAQCEGDIRSLPGCTTYVAFGDATHNGQVEMGRNFDYWGLDSIEECVRVFTVFPKKKGHYAFLSVGWAGILGGWTFYNEKGLFVANNIGGYNEKNPKGIPTLILQRMIAETAATVDEAIELIKRYPRMRGQAIILGHAGNPEEGIEPSAAVVLYDARTVTVKRPVGGFVFHSSTWTSKRRLRRHVKARKSNVYNSIRSAGTGITLHSVAIEPAAKTVWVAHGTRPGAHRGKYVPFNLRTLFESH